MNIILLSGGSGKRLWPLSNDIRSKQFIKIFKTVDGYESMVQRVNRQIKEVDAEANVTIATSKTQVSSIHNQLGSAVGVTLSRAAAIPSRPSHWRRPTCTMSRASDWMTLLSSARWIPMSTMTILPLSKACLTWPSRGTRTSL